LKFLSNKRKILCFFLLFIIFSRSGIYSVILIMSKKF